MAAADGAVESAGDAGEVTLVVVGDGAVGKTSMLISYTANTFPGETIPATIEEYTTSTRVEGRDIKLNLRDTSGQADYDRIRPASYAGADAVLILFSISSRSSFEHVRSKWALEVRKHLPEAPILLVGSKSDFRNDANMAGRLIPSTDGERLAREIGAVAYREYSALTQEGLKEVFDVAVRASLGARSAPVKVPAPANSGHWSVQKLTVNASQQAQHNFGLVLEVDEELIAAGGGGSLFLFRRGANEYEYCGQIGTLDPQYEHPVLDGPNGHRIAVNAKVARISGTWMIIENYRLDNPDEKSFKYKTQMDVLTGDRARCQFDWAGFSLWTQDQMRYVDKRVVDFENGIAAFGSPDKSVATQIFEHRDTGWRLAMELQPPQTPANTFFGSHGAISTPGATSLVAIGNTNRDNPADSTIEVYELDRGQATGVLNHASFKAPSPDAELELSDLRLRQGRRMFELQRSGNNGFSLEEMQGSPLSPKSILPGREIKAVAFAGNLAVISTPLKFNWDGGPDAKTTPGQVFVFAYEDGAWREIAAPATPAGATGTFGQVVRVQGGEIFVSDPLGSAVYVFRHKMDGGP